MPISLHSKEKKMGASNNFRASNTAHRKHELNGQLISEVLKLASLRRQVMEEGRW